jgi:hypothetical protein
MLILKKSRIDNLDIDKYPMKNHKSQAPNSKKITNYNDQKHKQKNFIVQQNAVTKF